MERLVKKNSGKRKEIQNIPDLARYTEGEKNAWERRKLHWDEMENKERFIAVLQAIRQAERLRLLTAEVSKPG